jgi:hypothetical protein
MTMSPLPRPVRQILIVDDDPAVAEVRAAVLSSIGYHCEGSSEVDHLVLPQML